MATIKRAKTVFTAGELAPELLGRGDVAAWAAGARRLRNVFILPTGGVRRRPGLRHVAPVEAPARLVPFEPAVGQDILLVLLPGAVRIFRGDVPIATLPAPWTAAMLPQVAYTQTAWSILLLHPAMPPQRLVWSGGDSFTITPYVFTRRPYRNFGDGNIAMQASAATGLVVLNTTAPFFTMAHENGRIRIRGKRLRIVNVNGPATATAEVEDGPVPTDLTTDWDEWAFGDARGWPGCACHHQNRLVLGGVRDCPQFIWLSRSGDPHDFDFGEGLDDQGISFPVAGDRLDAVRAVFAGRHLQVFTSTGEWMVTGDPLTPSSIQVARQTRVGSIADRMVPPLDVDGATIFAARSGRAVHEFSYTDVSGAYQAEDLGLVARHLINAPAAMAYDAAGRLLHVVTGDGALATLTLYRAENVTGWTRQETDGAFRDVVECGGAIYALVERNGAFWLERFDETLALDAGMSSVATAPSVVFGGLLHLESRDVAVLADGAPRGLAAVTGGAVLLDEPATVVQAGLPFAHLVEPLPPDTLLPGGTARTGPIRLVAATFRLLATSSLSVDLGRGGRPVPLRRLDAPMLDAPPPSFTGDVTLRGLGWRRDSLDPLWRVEGDAPLPFTLLSVTTETRTTD
ncbi:hypothetical protein ACE7GA_03045 [Roseomonas sp. CCTCC AB2023176]|uniref:hypothetical protein n=1 Tax=Roseomonas sp. CCTCC AB2023176 TaxID=3342640 RepID=UPI0035D836BD